MPTQPQQPTRSAPSQALQELWFATLRKPWTTLVVVPAEAFADAVWVARSLSEFGGTQSGGAIAVIETAGLDLVAIELVVARLKAVNPPGTQATRTIVAIEPIAENASGIAAALAADAALLCVKLGRSTIEAARHSVEQVGKDRFIGCAIVEE